jgi:hypothetical protein
VILLWRQRDGSLQRLFCRHPATAAPRVHSVCHGRFITQSILLLLLLLLLRTAALHRLFRRQLAAFNLLGF